MFGMQSSAYTDKDGAGSGDEEAPDEQLESQSDLVGAISSSKESSSLLSDLLTFPKQYGYPTIFSLIKEKLLIAPLVKLFGNQSGDRRKGVGTKGLEFGQERPTVDVTLEQDDNSKQSLETSKEPVNDVLTHEGNESSIYWYFFALPKWLGLAYYGLGIIGLLLTGPLAFILFYATCVHLILSRLAFF